MEINIRLLTGSYDRTDEDNIVVELFGKSDDQRSVLVRYSGFAPYFYLASNSPDLKKRLESDKNVISIKDVKLLQDGKNKDCLKVTIKHPWEVPAYRAELQNYCEVLAADIPFHHRFIYDMNLSSCVKVKGEDVTEQYKHKYSVDLVIDAKEFTNIPDFKPVLKVLSFDIENSLKRPEIFTIAATIKENDNIKSNTFEGSNADILKNFIRFIIKEDPDVITGYNIDGYDLPYLLDRAKEEHIEFIIGRDKSKPQRIMNQFWRIHGRVVVDTWWSVKKELRPKQESLNAVSKQLLGEEKLDVNRTQIDTEWEKDQKKVIEYCIKDSVLTLKIFEKLKTIEKYMDISTVSMLPLDDALNSGNSTLIDSILIREADRNNVAVPLMKDRGDDERIEGGYVHTINAGLYHWVCVLDFKSMYPSVIIKYNICFTTLDNDGDIVSPTGIKFLSAEKRKGLIPKILEDLMHQRDEIKRKMKGADEESKKHYDGVQQAIKILMNSFYGVFASSFYRFTNTDIGASITAFARETVKRIIQELESKKVSVIYGDTDSVFFQSIYDNLEKTIEFGESISKEISAKEMLTFEFQNVLEPFFSHGAKKRYVGRIVYPASQKGEIIVRGYETRRTDSFDMQSEALMKIFELILNNDIKGAKEESVRIINAIKNGEVNAEKLVISRSMKELRYYKNPKSMPNVQAYEKLKEMGEDVFPGMKVSWIVVSDKKSRQEVEPYIPGKKFEKKPDYDYYARRVAETLARVTEVFDMGQDQLLTGKKQKTLYDDTYKKKKRTLEEFM
jgi:DNA polymerase I